MEGYYGYDDGINYINILTIGRGCDFIFKDNHFESIQQIPLKLGAEAVNADVCIKGNNLIGVTESTYQKVHITKTNGGTVVLNISETNIPLLIKDVNYGLTLNFNDPVPFEMQNCNIVNIITSKR
jgi:hypothetical protein